MRKSLFLAVNVLTAAVFAAPTYTIDHVTVQQRWPWNGKVDIDYALASSDGSAADVELELYDGETKLAVPASAITGDSIGVQPGFRRLTFDPSASGLEATTYTAFNVRLTATEVPLYLVVDLTKSYGEDGLLTRISEATLRSGSFGTYEENPVSGIKSVIWTGVTNDETYATTKLVLRRIDPGTFKWGGGYQANTSLVKKPGMYPATNVVELTQPYYIGVFEMTQAQWKNLMGSYQQSYYRLNRDRRPCERTLPLQIRGSSTAWPTTGYTVGDGTILKALRDKTGMVFDLPTEAQWEYAARAGVETAYSDNYNYYNNDVTATASATQIRLLGRFSTNGGGKTETSSSGGSSIDVDQGTAIVGSYAPNAWGLYDVHGNVREWVLDYYPATDCYVTYAGTDPVGCSSGSSRIQKGGCHAYSEEHGYFGHRWATSQTGNGNNQSGFRVVAFPSMVAPKVGDLRPW